MGSQGPPSRAHRTLQRAAELVLGARCPSCGGVGWGACVECVAAVTGVRPFVVPGVPEDLPPVVAAGAYSGELRSLLLAAKERGALGLLPLLGERLAAAVAVLALAEDLGGPIVLVPIPSARGQVAERGVDLTGSLARYAARRLSAAGVAVRTQRALRLVRRPRDQAGLGREERLANLEGAFRAAAVLPGRVVLVDDIVTTGATLLAASRACAERGSTPAGAASVAATVRRSRRGAR